MARVVVVGAGIAGLSVAARLSDFGHIVTVLERNTEPGGQIGTEVIDGVSVDTGPTTLTLPAVFRDLFRKTGRPLEREVELVPVDPAVRYVFPDGECLDLPNASRAATTAVIDGAFGPGAGRQWDQLIRDAEAMWQLIRPRLLDRSPSARDLIWLALNPQARKVLHRGSSLRDFGARHLEDPRLRLVLDSYATSLGGSPERTPAALAVLAYLEQTFGTWTVRGGLHTLVKALVQRITDRGGVLRLGASATRIESGSRSVKGVVLDDGEVLKADVVVSTVPPGHLELDELRARRWTTAPTEGRSVFTVLLSLRSQPALPPRSVLLTEDGPNVTLAHRGDKAPGDSGAIALHADCSAHDPGAKLTDWTERGTAETHAQQLLGLAAARGVDLNEHIKSTRLRTPYDLEQEVGAPGGRVYGTPWHGGSSIRRRLTNRSPVHGLFFAGASAHPGPGLPMAAISAALVADLVGRA
ncbi:FAD-dependent oxidoreductase [Phytoactinopolyspora alkaliphila]|uniref:FAD-dependent oxidoreductase n=1 Tax=Phytoactinopolyspora alkaliphila TaxID=1783498 RepID=A0A6N9YRS1_9ACTN|nr:FAD-dependent oxidoreductase [Phytoactinopolyspora alkaliphila]